jgi:hypothetical protein
MSSAAQPEHKLQTTCHCSNVTAVLQSSWPCCQRSSAWIPHMLTSPQTSTHCRLPGVIMPWRRVAVGGVMRYDTQLVTYATNHTTKYLTRCDVGAISVVLFPYWFTVYTYQALSQNCEERRLASSRVCLSARMEQLGSHWTDFHEMW